MGYRQHSVNLELLDEELKSLLGDASPGDVNLIDNAKQLQLIRILDSRERPPKAFNEVSAEIRKKLAPIARMEKLNEHAQALRSKATIQFTGPQMSD